MNHLAKHFIKVGFTITIYFLVLGVMAAHAQSPVKRIAILPVYLNDAQNITLHATTLHSKRMLSHIDYWEMNRDFEVVNPFDNEADKKRISKLFSGNPGDMGPASEMLCREYDLDAVILVILDTMALEFSSGNWKASIQTRMEGYNRQGAPLGISEDENIVVMDVDFGSALNVAQEELGYRISRTLSIQLSRLNRPVRRTARLWHLGNAGTVGTGFE